MAQFIGERSANGQRIVLYDKNNRRHFYLNDHLGSARVLVDSAGTKRDVYKYYAFGSRAGGTAGTNQAYRYTTKPFDEELDLDLYYYGAR